MAKTGGARAGAGRRVGSVSQRSVDAVSDAAAAGLLPVEYMLSIMRDEDADPKERAWAAEKASPYIHPRPAPIQRRVGIDLPDTSTAEGISRALAKLTQAAASGDIAPSEAQSFAVLIEAQRKAIETGEIMKRLEALEAMGAKR